jgi:hypothetical protein
MSLRVDMPASARRNLEAADSLPEARFHVAGYLYGLAAECAVKAMLEELGIRPLARTARREDPYYQHFPILLTAALDVASGRRSGTLNRVLLRRGFMAGWSTEIRYAAAGQITPAMVGRWQEQAKQAVASIGT